MVDAGPPSAIAVTIGADEDPPVEAGLRAGWPTVLVSMPFMDIGWPSIQLGLLSAILAEHHYPVRTLHANLDFAARLGVEEYRRLCGRGTSAVADWLFSVEAFGDEAPDPDGHLLTDYAADLSEFGDDATALRKRLLRIRREVVPAYLDALADDPVWDSARVVGFTSTFQQNTASFALARRLKRRNPELITVFGGANFDGEMGPEWVRAIGCVDLAVVGEADTALPRLMDRLVRGADPRGVPGVVCRVGDEVVATAPAAPSRHLDDLPIPDYAEYFARSTRLGLRSSANPPPVQLPFESSRGCWWGQKHHCTFCGLNGSTMRFRAKSPQRVADELMTQARRYRSFRFHAVDNILDMAYVSDLFPAMAEADVMFEIFYEVKANLTRSQIRTLAHGGVTSIQPGIESLSSRVLRLMRKGTRAAQNVNLLRWASYYGITAGWNILWGFPGETAQDYEEQARLLPHLWHLGPPASAERLWIERFSPLYQTSPTKTPELSYRYVFPDRIDLRRVAYFFQYELPDALDDGVYQCIRDGVADWKKAWERPQRPTLTFRSSPGLVQIYDQRHEGSEGTYTFEGALADLYSACSDRPINAAAMQQRLGGRLTLPEIHEAFTELHRLGLVFLDESSALALALPAGTPR